MTEEQQAGLARFLDTAYGFLSTGYLEKTVSYNFDAFNVCPTAETGAGLAAEVGTGPDPGGSGITATRLDKRHGRLFSEFAEISAQALIQTEPRSDYGAQGGAAGKAAVCRKMSGNCAPLISPESDKTDGLNPIAELDAVADCVRGCTLCGLHTTRIKAVPGEGVERPLALVVGEGPGADEDSSGRPFVGAAGRLLDQMLLSIGLDRKKNCFIANVIKCRPPSNRDPLPAETAACFPFFERQLAALRPLVLLTVGKVPVKTLLGTDEGITRLRGNWKSYRGIPLLPTFHPSYLLRDESQKKFAWEDLKALCRRLVELDPGYAAESAELRRARNI